MTHARLKAIEDPAGVREELEGIERNEEGYEIYEDASVLNDFLEHEVKPEHPVAESIEKAQEAFKNQDYSDTLNFLIQGINIDRHYADDLMRKTCIAIFRLLGEEHTITRKHRRRFDMALY